MKRSISTPVSWLEGSSGGRHHWRVHVRPVQRARLAQVRNSVRPVLLLVAARRRAADSALLREGVGSLV
jgi:hypothetical protein